MERELYRKTKLRIGAIAETPGVETGAEKGAVLPQETLDMYNLPGVSPLNREDIERYKETKRKLLNELPALIREGLKDNDWDVRQSAAQMIEHAPERERPSLEAFVSALIREGLKDNNWDVRQSAAQMIEHAPEGERATLIREGLKDNNWYVRRLAAQMIEHAPEGERATLIREGLKDNDWDVRQSAAQMIEHAPEGERATLIREGLKDNDWDVRQSAAQMIEHAPEGERATLIREGLKDNNWYVRQLAAQMIEHAPERERATLIREGLKDNDWDVRQSAAQMIEHAPERERATLIREGLKDNNWDVRQSAAQMIEHAPEGERATLIREGLKDNNWYVRRLAVQMIEHAPERERQSLLEIAGISSVAGGTNRSELEQLEKFAATTPLYENAEGKFFRKEFTKTGSRIILLDSIPGRPEKESLKHRVIIREINIVPYFNWAKAFESAEFWRSKGLDYVPVEPILSVRADKKRIKAQVFTRVLGPSVAQWTQKTQLFSKEINKMVDVITKGINELGIEHGHMHRNNFCLVFEDGENNKPDLSRPPRVYVIDFDAARSSGRGS